MISLVVLGTCALAVDTPGTTEIAWSGSPTLDFVNVSLKGSDGDFWFGADFVDPSYPLDPGVRVVSSTPFANSSKVLQAS